MISREEAKEMIIASYDEYKHNINMAALDKIYDSIGSCGECKHYNKCGECELALYFTNGGYMNNYMEKDIDDYCKKFERK